jgi:hypothetical protein
MFFGMSPSSVNWVSIEMPWFPGRGSANGGPDEIGAAVGT